jgi:Rne/Rng family ribonuclease
MAKEICISSTPHETRLAILEDDQLAEIYYERENEYTLAGSIYNGRVTRVLPGMQSAFVDVGLERDAFLYVTDFLELEDSEESDELEKAAASGGSQAPREVRHANGQEKSPARQEDRGGARPVQKPEPKQEPRQEQRPPQDRGGRTNRPMMVEQVPEADDTSAARAESTFSVEQKSGAQEESGEPGAKRWRGRRRRRGGRGSAGSSEGQAETQESRKPSTEFTPEDEEAPDIYAAASGQAAQEEAVVAPRGNSRSSSPVWTPAAPPPPARADRAPAPFVLPGESLSKYGGTPAAEAASAPSPANPARPSSTFKPSSLIEVPLEWDGSGLLPGESLSKHRGREPEPFPVAEPTREVDPKDYESAADEIEEEAFVTEMTEAELESSAEQNLELTEEDLAPEAADDEFEETAEMAPVQPQPEAAWDAPSHTSAADYTVEPVTEQPLGDEPIASPVKQREGGVSPAPADSAEAAQNEPDATASHHVDPSGPTGFRLFGLDLGKKKKEEEAAALKAKPTSVATVSAYAPGPGLIEEELIEEEEFDAPRHHHHSKAEEHDVDDFEEETLPTQLRTGDLGEMLQEAHLDHRIQLNFDQKNGDVDLDDEEDDEEPLAEGQPAPSEGQQRRDRGTRGRRGRGTQGAPSGQPRGRGPARRSMQTSDLPIISDLLKPGQEILVQIAKEPIAKKGARITSHIALPGRFLVFMPTVSHIGVSRKIASDEERQRLKRVLVSERGDAAGGFIVRTAAEGASEEELRADLRFLLHLWDEIKMRSDTSKSPALIYHDLSLIERILRDQVSSNFSNIWVDSEADYERIVRFLNRFSPTLVRRVKLYTKETPLFEHFGIQDEISKALRSKVWLKSGGSIVINQTEALVAIDINTGKYVGKSARLEDTILKTNLDAVPEIVRQIRLRDLGGIIVIDFIDMDERKNRFRVMAALEEALKTDRAPTKVLQFNDFGLVAITRKRVKQSLERTLSVPCPVCQATGMVKSPTTVCNEIYTELRKMKKHFEGADVLLRVNPETVKVLKANNASWLTELEELAGKNILIKSDATLHPEQFDIQG